jgi:hypothetical protein
MVDWSASSRPKLGRDSVWIGIINERGALPELTNAATRTLAESLIEEAALRLQRESAQLILGLDFALTYPSIVTELLVPPAARPSEREHHPAHQLWSLIDRLIVDEPSNHNNRIDVAGVLNERLGEPLFWGLPTYRGTTSSVGDSTPTVPGRLVPTPLPRFRACDRLAAAAAGSFISSPFQLFGAGAVGSQSLLGMAMLGRLERRLGLIDLWPYEHRSAPIVVVEVWPTLSAPDATTIHPDVLIKDQAQVTECVLELASSWNSRSTNTLDLTEIPTDGWIYGV